MPLLHATPETPVHAGLRAMFGRLAREPLVHFLVIGAAVFALSALSGSNVEEETDDRRIVVTQGRIAQMVQVFARTWQRSPTQEELRGLVDGFVKEEIYYREAVKLGLDRDDTLVRRRMQHKMKFLIEPEESALKASDEELRAYLRAHREFFRVEPKITFSQIYLDPEADGPPVSERVERLLARLRSPEARNGLAALGDHTMLQPAMTLTPVSGVAREFGREFAAALGTLPRGQWAGPVRSSYGVHLVRVTRFDDGYVPPLAEIRDAVETRWRQDRREAHINTEYEKLRAKYEVLLPIAQREGGAQ